MKVCDKRYCREEGALGAGDIKHYKSLYEAVKVGVTNDGYTLVTRMLFFPVSDPNLDPLYLPLTENKVDFMTGDRFGGQMGDGAMSWSHKLGVPFLSWCGRVKFGVKIHDWHCGIRGIRRDALQKLNLQTDGMEFATEMIAESSRKGLRIGEVSVPLKRAQNERQEILRTIRDGFRHLWYIVRA